MEAFVAAKKLLVTAPIPVLAHYDLSLPMKMAKDASAYGIRAVIFMCTRMGANSPLHTYLKL